MKYRNGSMGINRGRRPALTRVYVPLLAVAFVSLLSWSSSNGDSVDPASGGSHMLAPDLADDVTRAAPSVARAQDLDRSLDRRSHAPSATIPLTAPALGLIAAAVTVVVHSAMRAQLASVVGSRGPPSLRLGPTHRPA
jgi:hypothetical protein